MTEPRIERRLAAILAADVAEYGRLMGEDEAGTRARFNELSVGVVEPSIAAHGGRLVKTMGDGVLVEHRSVVDAVQCALRIQEGAARLSADQPDGQKLRLRIGIHLGDVIVEGDDIHGDGVNIAARLEALAAPGGICVSDMVHAGVRNKLTLVFDDLGEKSLKNIADPVRVFSISPDADAEEVPTPSGATFDRPAVAVLPFENMSGEDDQQYFADGLTEDIIGALSRWRTFPVIARNSTFAYKGQSRDIRRIGEALGARYVVEGSVRRAGERIRIAAQLIDAQTGHQVWSDRYDGDVGDIFALQDEISERIAAIVEPTLERTEHRRIASKPPSDLAAWEFWLRGYELIYEATDSSNETAREMFSRAIELDPQYARAHTGLAYTYVKDLRYFRQQDRDERLSRLFESARRAVALDESDSEARTMLARAHMFAGRFEDSVEEARRAVDLNPHRAFSNQVLGNMLIIAGRFDEGIPWIERALKLNPLDPQNHLFVTHLALAHLGGGDFPRAVELARDAIRRQPDFNEPHVLLAAALGHLEQVAEARDAITPFGDIAPTFVERERPYWSDATKQCVAAGLRKAGLAE